MTRDSVVRLWSAVAARAMLCIAFAPRAWRERVAARRREHLGQIDRMSDHMLRDTGLARWDEVRRAADRLRQR